MRSRFLKRFPDPGELNQRVTIKCRVDRPIQETEVIASYPLTRKVWACVYQVTPTVVQGDAQTETTVTHHMVIRFLDQIHSGDEVFYAGHLYRVQRILDLNSHQRYLRLECEDFGKGDHDAAY